MRASHCRGLSCCGAQAPDAQAQQLWLTGPDAPRHVGSSQTRARTRVPCIGRQILNHCATREAPKCIFIFLAGPCHFYHCLTPLPGTIYYMLKTNAHGSQDTCILLVASPPTGYSLSTWASAIIGISLPNMTFSESS